MKRRTYITAAGLGAVAGAGCLDTLSAALSPTHVPDGMTVEREYVGDDVLEDGLFERLPDELNHGAILSDRDAVSEGFASDDPDVWTLLEETDFSESYLAVAQHGASSSREIDLRALERTGETLAVELSVSRSGSHEYDDLGVHSLVMRVTEDGDGSPPAAIEVTD